MFTGFIGCVVKTLMASVGQWVSESVAPNGSTHHYMYGIFAGHGKKLGSYKGVGGEAAASPPQWYGQELLLL